MIVESQIIVFSGPPCSGKSLLAQELHCRTGIVRLELDSLRSRLIPESKHEEADRDIAYRAMHIITEYLARCGQAVILDATYARTSHRSALRELAVARGVPLKIIQCRVSADVAVQRFKERRPGHYALDLSEQRVRALAIDYPYSDDVLTLETTEAVETSMDRVISYL